MKITDLLTLTSFIQSVVASLPAIKHFLPLSNGEKAVDEISAYYTNDYAGTTAFWQIAESGLEGQLLTFKCSLTIATKPDDVGTMAGLAARNLTFKLLFELLGKLQLEADSSIETVEDEGDMYDLGVLQASPIFPIGLLANVNLEGHYVDLDITVPVTHLLFPN